MGAEQPTPDAGIPFSGRNRGRPPEDAGEAAPFLRPFDRHDRDGLLPLRAPQAAEARLGRFCRFGRDVDRPSDARLAPVEVREGDCLVAARELVEAGEGEVCVLNMASRRNPGGGVHTGAGAQEEHLFRSSDYFRSLYRFADYGASYGVPRAAESYPLDRDHGVVFSVIDDHNARGEGNLRPFREVFA